MFSSRRNRAVAVLLSAAVIAPTTALGVSSAVAQSDESGTSKTQTDTRKRSGRGHGPDTAALATKLGVTQAKLKAAFEATRPAGKPGKGDRGAGMATDLAAALGVSVDKLKPILEANRPEKPATRPAAGSKPDTTALVSAISDGLGIEKSTVQAALDKLRASHEADHTARRNAMSTALAKELGIDAATVKSALAELRPAGRR